MSQPIRHYARTRRLDPTTVEAHCPCGWAEQFDSGGKASRAVFAHVDAAWRARGRRGKSPGFGHGQAPAEIPNTPLHRMNRPDDTPT